MCAPVVGDGRAGYLKQPFLDAQRPTLRIDSPHCFHKYLRCEVLCLFAIAHFTVDVAIDPTEVLLIKCLKFLNTGSSRTLPIGGLFCRHEVRLRLFSAMPIHFVFPAQASTSFLGLP